MESPTSACSMTSHQAIMKCPWQWRQPFLDEKLESRKRKVGDGQFYDPVDPSFVDHLLPGHAKKFCESDEKEQIQREIARLKMQKQAEEQRREEVDREPVIYDSLVFTNEDDARSPATSPVAKEDDDMATTEVSSENQALVDSILMMSKAVEKASLLVSPQSSFAASDDEDATSGEDEASLTPHPSPCLELVSDNLEEDFFSADDDDLLA